MRIAFLVGLVAGASLALASAATAFAQPRATERGAAAPDVEAVLDAARLDTEAGRFAAAYGRLDAATARSDAPRLWRALADAADRLRMDEAAADALSRYLALRPDAPDRAMTEARLRVLRQVLEGGRYVEAGPEGDGAVRLILDWEGEPARPRGGGAGGSHILVDWSGRPLAGRRTAEMLALADWDGDIRGGDGPPIESGGLGHRLAAP